MGSPYTRTSKSLLRDRHVRVYRQERINDGAGGTYLDFTLIIERYWVRITPDQHTLRNRVEPGDQEAKNAYRAVADPSHNGKTIRVGDRFHDVRNNQCYDVVAVRRPRPGLSYGVMVTFELRIVKDGCQEPVPPYVITSPAAPVQNLFIMRHMAGDEIIGWENLPYFDGVIYNLQYDKTDQIAALAGAVAAGKRYFRYYNILLYPHSATLFGGTTPPLASWFNFLRDNFQFFGSATGHRFRSGSQVVIFPEPAASDGQRRELIPWGLMTAGERSAAEQRMWDLARAPGGVSIHCCGMFFDQAWTQVHSFQASTNPLHESGHGDTKESMPRLTSLPFATAEALFGDGGTWFTHWDGLDHLYDESDALVASGGVNALGVVPYVIKNGEHRTLSGRTIPKPWMFENAFDNNVDLDGFPGAVSGFVTDPRNILSILCSAAPNSTVGVPEAIAQWEANGGWLSFTDDGSPEGAANLALAYQQAATVLAAHGWGTG